MSVGGNGSVALVQPSKSYPTYLTRAVGAVVSLVLIRLVARSTAAPLDLAETENINIPAQSLATSMLQFSSQAHIQIAASGTEVGQTQSPGAVGSMSIGAALSVLLNGTGFSYQISGARSIAIFLRQKNIPAAPPTGPPIDASP